MLKTIANSLISNGPLDESDARADSISIKAPLAFYYVNRVVTLVIVSVYMSLPQYEVCRRALTPASSYMNI